MPRWALLAALSCLPMSACAVYQPLPLPEASDLQPLAALMPAAMPAAPVRLTIAQAATIAVLHNPDLMAARRKAGVAAAQAFAAGLLPDPRISASLKQPVNSPISGLVNGYGLGFTIDLHSLLIQPSREQQARYASDQAILGLLWQEWQTAAKAESLCIQVYFLTGELALLRRSEDLYAGRSRRSGQALAAGETTTEQASGDLVRLADARTRSDTAKRALLAANQDLIALLGARPEAAIAIADPGTPVLPPEPRFADAVGRAVKDRPDLQALRAGYQSQEAAVQQAVLSQFPSVSVGFTRASDTGNVHSNDFGITLNLPLFDRGRGGVAVQEATRGQLRAEYQARLDQAEADAWRIRRDAALLAAQIADLDGRLPRLAAQAERAAAAYRTGAVAAPAYLSMRDAWASQAIRRLVLQSAYWNDVIALRIIIGMTPTEQGGG